MVATIYHDEDADLAAIEGSSVAVVGYGNQGRSWALNLRDSGFDVHVCVRADETRDKAVADGFKPLKLEDASESDIVCVLIPDDRGPRYVLATDGPAAIDPHVVEARLARNPQYAYARTLNQLEPLRVRAIPDLLDRFIARQVSRGVRLADVKPLSLVNDSTWVRALETQP